MVLVDILIAHAEPIWEFWADQEAQQDQPQEHRRTGIRIQELRSRLAETRNRTGRRNRIIAFKGTQTDRGKRSERRKEAVIANNIA